MNTQEFYEQYNYPPLNSGYFFDHSRGYITISPLIGTEQKEKILVVGCGTAEANVVANSNPESIVTGIDFSKSSLTISKSIKRKFNMSNLTLIQRDITEGICDTYDSILASGVLHHISNVEKALQTISNALTETGKFVGMVYNKNGRPDCIKRLNEIFIKKEFNINQALDYMTEHNETEAIQWVNNHILEVEEIADTWLNPYFTDYDENSLRKMLSIFFNDVNVFLFDDDKTKLYFKCQNNFGPAAHDLP